MTWEAFSMAGQPNRQNLSLKEPSMSSRKVWKREVWFFSRLWPMRRRCRTIETLLWRWKHQGLKARLRDWGLFGSCSWFWSFFSKASFRGRLSSLAVLRVGGTRFAAPCTELASWSAISLLSIPTWLGIQMIETLLPDIMMTFARRLIVGMDGGEKGRL